MIAPKSAIVAAPMISWPNVVETSPASFSTGMRTPREVAQRMIATSRGVSTMPTAPRPMPATSASANDSANPAAVSRSACPRSLSNSISSPARKSTKASPIRATTSIDWSTSTRPRTAGPITMPAMISSTTEGRRSRGNRPSANGAAKATATTMSRSPNWGMSCRLAGSPGRYAARSNADRNPTDNPASAGQVSRLPRNRARHTPTGGLCR